LEQVLEKIEIKHSVQAFEVEEVFKGKPRVQLIQKGKVRGVNLYVATGQTKHGRYIAVFFIYKKTKEALIVTARDMDKGERRLYEERHKRR
jgi:uncharacterized DUF497 family protein